MPLKLANLLLHLFKFMKKLTVVFSVYSTRLPKKFKPEGAVVIPSIAKLQLTLLQEASDIVEAFNSSVDGTHHVFHIFNQLSLLRIMRHIAISYNNIKLDYNQVEVWAECEPKQFIQARIDSYGDFIDHLPKEVLELSYTEVFGK